MILLLCRKCYCLSSKTKSFCLSLWAPSAKAKTTATTREKAENIRHVKVFFFFQFLGRRSSLALSELLTFVVFANGPSICYVSTFFEHFGGISEAFLDIFGHFFYLHFWTFLDTYFWTFPEIFGHFWIFLKHFCSLSPSYKIIT